jgi:hypothetical protein
MPAEYRKIEISHELLNSDPNAFFVFGDDLNKQNLEGAAALRLHPRAIGFPVCKTPLNIKGACFKPEEYSKLFFDSLKQLLNHVKANPQRKFYITKLGSGIYNRYYIWETLIHHNLVNDLGEYSNVVFCWESESLVTQ